MNGCLNMLLSHPKMLASQGSLCVAGPHVVAPKSPPVVLWFVIGCYPNHTFNFLYKM